MNQGHKADMKQSTNPQNQIQAQKMNIQCEKGKIQGESLNTSMQNFGKKNQLLLTATNSSKLISESIESVETPPIKYYQKKKENKEGKIQGLHYQIINQIKQISQEQITDREIMFENLDGQDISQTQSKQRSTISEDKIRKAEAKIAKQKEKYLKGKKAIKKHNKQVEIRSKNWNKSQQLYENSTKTLQKDLEKMYQAFLYYKQTSYNLPRIKAAFKKKKSEIKELQEKIKQKDQLILQEQQKNCELQKLLRKRQLQNDQLKMEYDQLNRYFQENNKVAEWLEEYVSIKKNSDDYFRSKMDQIMASNKIIEEMGNQSEEINLLSREMNKKYDELVEKINQRRILQNDFLHHYAQNQVNINRIMELERQVDYYQMNKENCETLKQKNEILIKELQLAQKLLKQSLQELDQQIKKGQE